MKTIPYRHVSKSRRKLKAIGGSTFNKNRFISMKRIISWNNEVISDFFAQTDHKSDFVTNKISHGRLSEDICLANERELKIKFSNWCLHILRFKILKGKKGLSSKLIDLTDQINTNWLVIKYLYLASALAPTAGVCGWQLHPNPPSHPPWNSKDCLIASEEIWLCY